MTEWRCIKSTEINTKSWNALVRGSFNEHIYGYSDYLNRLGITWIGFVYGDYEAVIPFFLKKKIGFNYYCQVNHFQRNTIYRKTQEIPDKKRLEELILSKVSYFDFTSSEEFQLKNALKTNRSNYFLDLNKSYDDLELQFSKNLNRNIKKAKRQNIKLEQCYPSEIKNALSLFQNNTSYNLPKSWIETLEILAQQDYATLFAAKKDEKKLAFCLIIESEKRITLLFTALHSAGKEAGAMPYLIAELLKRYTSSKKLFDFEGSDNSGVARFYKSFGSKLETYYYYKTKKILKIS